MFDKIKTHFAEHRVKRETLRSFEQLMRQVVADGVVTDQEMDMIGRFYHDNGLAPHEYHQIRDLIFRQVVAGYSADRRISEAEHTAIMHIGRRLGVAEKELSEVSANLNYFSLLHQVENAPFESLPAMRDSGMILQRGEIDYVCFGAQLLEERVVKREIVGRSSGMSFRIMKGVSYRVGQSRGQILTKTGVVPISRGHFVITNQRLVFLGDKKSVNAPLNKLLDIEAFTDGLRISLTNRQKPVMVQFFTPQSSELMTMYASRVINQ